MINPHNVLKVLSNLTSNKISLNSLSPINNDEEHVTSNLYTCLESILESISHIFETENTLDHDDELFDEDVENSSPLAFTDEDLDSIKDADYELIDEFNLQNHFSLDYMKQVVDYYDEKDPVTGKLWGLKKARELHLTDFQASESWLWNFQFRYEPSGRIDDNVKKNLFHAKNILLTGSKSDKLTSSLITYWVSQCLFPNLRSRMLLLLDSLPRQTHPKFYEELKDFEYRGIPPKTISMIQLLDLYYNRQHKKIVGRIYD
ncbi:unnamed protein product [Adineta ricciae]|uniref:Uncharacterized protein n=1 Tax=Adineta ricciae TaxID=249248 RepID=A0A815J1M9_ADIRI|nr:unnamed protein product [Adineta ricciae]